MPPMSSIPTYPLKGSRALILQALRAHALSNCCVLSYEELAELTGYCSETIRISVRKLVHERFISVEKQLGERRNMYRLQRWEG